MATVSVQRVESYDQALVNRAIAAHFEALGVEKDIKQGMKVLLKPNLLTGRRPELCVTTHPAVVRAVAEWFRARGVTDIVLADSPGGPFRASILSAAYKAAGYAELADVVQLNLDVGAREAPAAPGSSYERFTIINAVLDADYIVNLAKMKTHGMTTVSLGIKNLLGAVPGLLKPRMHYENPGMDAFSNMLVSLALTVKPNLTLIDAVYGMEGNGPGGGTPRYAGLILMSRDVFAQDHFAATLMGIDPERVGMLARARAQGLIDPEGPLLVGDSVSPFVPPFALPDTKRLDFLSHVPGFIRKPASALMDKLVVSVPMVRRERCIGCAKCQESCPQHIIEMKGKKAVIAKKGCISCFCCQEMCPVKAIEVHKTLRRR